MTRILVAEDNPSSRELFYELLTVWGHEVVEACDGEAALQMITEVTPDLVLLDIQMPLMDGYAVLRRMRQEPRLAGIPVIAVTGFAMQGDREEALAAGFNGYHSKPINSKVLKNEIQALLEKAAGQGGGPSQVKHGNNTRQMRKK